MLHDHDRDKDAKVRLQEIMNKYNIKQVEVARETGKLRNLYDDPLLLQRHPPLQLESLAAGKDQRARGEDNRDDRELSWKFHVKQAKNEHGPHLEAFAAEIVGHQRRARSWDDQPKRLQHDERGGACGRSPK